MSEQNANREVNTDEKKQAKKDKLRGLLVRTISAIVVLIIGGSALYFGGWFLAIVLGFVTFAGVYELLKVFGLQRASMGVITYIFTGFFNIALFFKQEQFYVPIQILFLLAMLTMYVIKYPKYEVKQMTSSFFAFFYVVVCLSYMFRMRYAKNGLMFVGLILLTACGNDIFAYLVGIMIGKHKIFPNLSPKKTWEGFFGGILGAALCGLLYGFIISKNSTTFDDINLPIIFMIICGLGALPAVVGDLAASAIKRNYGIKDYSNLIPGHGGILDRFDSMIFTSPIVYFLIQFFLGSYIEQMI